MRTIEQIWIDCCEFKQADPIQAKQNKKHGVNRSKFVAEESRTYKPNLRFVNTYQNFKTKPVLKTESRGLRTLFTHICFKLGYQLKDIYRFLDLNHATVIAYRKQMLLKDESDFLEQYIKPPN